MPPLKLTGAQVQQLPALYLRMLRGDTRRLMILFEAWDEINDNSVQLAELKKGMSMHADGSSRTEQPSPSEFKHLWSCLDPAGVGKVTIAELQVAMAAQLKALEQHEREVAERRAKAAQRLADRKRQIERATGRTYPRASRAALYESLSEGRLHWLPPAHEGLPKVLRTAHAPTMPLVDHTPPPPRSPYLLRTPPPSRPASRAQTPESGRLQMHHEAPTPARPPSKQDSSKGPALTPMAQGARLPRRATSAHTLRSGGGPGAGGSMAQPRSPLLAAAPSPSYTPDFHRDLSRTVRMIFEEESLRGGTAGAAARGYLASSGARPMSSGGVGAGLSSGGVGAGLRPSRLVGAIPQPMHLSRPATAGSGTLFADLRFG